MSTSDRGRPGASERNEWPNALESFSETARRMGLPTTSIVLRNEVVPATLDEAEGLSIAPGTGLFHIDRVRMLDRIPVAIDRSLVPAALAPSLSVVDFSRASLYRTLAEGGVDLVSAETTIEAQEADGTLAEHLDVELGRPVLVMRQIVCDRAGRRLFTSEVQYAGDRYRLRTSFARG